MNDGYPLWLRPRISDVVPEKFETVRGRLGAQAKRRTMTDKQKSEWARAGAAAHWQGMTPEQRSDQARRARAVWFMRRWKKHYPGLQDPPPISYLLFRVVDLLASNDGPLSGMKIVHQLDGVISGRYVYEAIDNLLALGIVETDRPIEQGRRHRYQITLHGRLVLQQIQKLIEGSKAK